MGIKLFSPFCLFFFFALVDSFAALELGLKLGFKQQNKDVGFIPILCESKVVFLLTMKLMC